MVKRVVLTLIQHDRRSHLGKRSDYFVPCSNKEMGKLPREEKNGEWLKLASWRCHRGGNSIVSFNHFSLRASSRARKTIVKKTS